MPPKTIGIIAHTGKAGVGDLVNAIAQEFARFFDHACAGKRNSAIAGKKSGIPSQTLALRPIFWL